MELENIILNKAIQTQKDKCSFLFEDPSAKSLDVNIEPN